MAPIDIQGLTSKHLTVGSTPPSAPRDGKFLLYNMRYCPYAERALIALVLKGIPFEVVNINLKDKPEWYIKTKNPLGKVPSIEHNGKIVYESLVCVDYLDDLFPEKQLAPKDPYERARQKMLIERLSALAGALYPLYRDRNNEALLKKVEEVFDLYESLLEHKFFAGDKPGYVDYMIWPWLERLGAAGILTDGRVAVNSGKHSKLSAYIDRMHALPELSSVILSDRQHAEFIQGFISGNVVYERD